MKKLILLAIALTFISKAQALYFGNVASPEIVEEGMWLSKDYWMSLKAGYQGDYTWDRKLRAHSGASGTIDQFKSHLNQGVFTINFADRVELYANAGTMNVFISQRPKNVGPAQREYQSDDHITWGYGGRGILLHWRNTILGLAGAMQYANIPFDWESLNGETFSADYHKTKLKYNEWQLGISLAQRIEILTPYIAVEYSRVRAELKHIVPELDIPENHFKMNNRVYVGVNIGCTISMGTIFDLNMEVRLIDELSGSIAANAKF